MPSINPRRRVAALLAAALLGTAACSDFLRVENPGAIEEPDIGSPAYTTLLVNGVIGEFQPAFSSTALLSGVFTDELSNWHGFYDFIEIDRRAVTYTTGTYAAFTYTPLQSARFMADTTAVLLRRFLGDTASRDVRLARTLAYGGYAFDLLAEQMCEAPIGKSAAYTPEQLFGFALERFGEAITVAQAARSHNAGLGTAGQANVRSADSLIALARVGSARALLNLNRKSEAAAVAAQVPAGFEYRVYHSSSTAGGGRLLNPFWSAADGGPNAQWVGITHTPFESITGDPRVPRPTGKEKMQQDSALVPNSPQAFSTYNGTITGANVAQNASIRFASGLEAQYVVAEAQGATPTNVDFLNSRRAIGAQTPLVLPSEAEFQAALREQRARDLYLAGYRLGDLRRYKKYQGVDLFPKGAYRGPSNLALPPEFGSAECFPIPLSEYNDNPNLPRP